MISFRRSLTGAFVALALLATSLGVMPSPVAAEIAPTAEDTWGVYNSVLNGTQTDRVDTEVMAIEQIGNRVFVGGKFTDVRSWSGGTPIAQSFLAAFDAQTGSYIADFTPTLDGPVYALEASPDGSRLFVGGEFGDVSGVPNTKALVALNPTTGAVDPTWKAQIKRDGVAVVYGLTASSSWMYAVGSFTGIGGAEGVPLTTVSNAVRVSYTTGAPDLSWLPQPNSGAVWGASPSPDGSKVYLAGFFQNVGNVNTGGFAQVQASDGALLPGGLVHNNPARENYYDVLAVNNLVFVVGMEHIVWVLNGNDLSVVTRHSTGGFGADFQLGGDYQDLELVGDRVYASCHCRGEHFADGDIRRMALGLDPPDSFSRRDPIKFVAAYSASNGSYIPSFTLDVSGSSGVWAVHGSPDGCLWVGGDLTRATRANGTNQARGGFTKHCEPGAAPDTERPSVPTGLALAANGSAVSMNWNASSDNVGVVGIRSIGPPQMVGLGRWWRRLRARTTSTLVLRTEPTGITCGLWMRLGTRAGGPGTNQLWLAGNPLTQSARRFRPGSSLRQTART